jgi:hypothetical protein
MKEQVRNALLDLMSWDKGEFMFEDTPSPEFDDIAIDVSDMLLEASLITRSLILDAPERQSARAGIGPDRGAPPEAAGSRKLLLMSEARPGTPLISLITGWPEETLQTRFGEEAARLIDEECRKGRPLAVIADVTARPRTRSRKLEQVASLKRKFPQVEVLVIHDGLPQAQGRRLREAGVRLFIECAPRAAAVRVEMIVAGLGEAVAKTLGQTAGGENRPCTQVQVAGMPGAGVRSNQSE